MESNVMLVQVQVRVQVYCTRINVTNSIDDTMKSFRRADYISISVCGSMMGPHVEASVWVSPLIGVRRLGQCNAASYNPGEGAGVYIASTGIWASMRQQRCVLQSELGPGG